jgi:hypothetical protein
MMEETFVFVVEKGEDLAFPQEVRCRSPPRIRLEGICRYTADFTHARLTFDFVEQPDAYWFQVRAEPPLDKPFADLSYKDAKAAAENAGLLRHLELPNFLKYFTRAIKDTFAIPGKRPFSDRRKAKAGEIVPAAYFPYGVWQRKQEQGPFDLATSVELDLPKRYTRPRELFELVEDLYNPTYRFVSRPASVTVSVQP